MLQRTTASGDNRRVAPYAHGMKRHLNDSHSRPVRRSCTAVAALLAGGLLSVLLLPSLGCAKKVYPLGERFEATYAARTLTARLPDSVRVPVAFATMEEVLKDRGYSVSEVSVTEDAGRMIARSPRTITYPRVVIEAHQSATACVISIRNEPFGDKDQSEQLMRALIERLGV